MTQPAPAKGGMPKWLIILLVVLLIVILGCCGGFTACFFKARSMAREVSKNVGDQWAAGTQKAHDELMAATQKAADDARRQGLGGAGTPEPGTGGVANPASGGGTPTTPTTPVAIGANNLPSDIPLMPGLTSTGFAVNDKVSGSGGAQYTSKSSPADVTAYYQKQLVAQGWTLKDNISINGTSAVSFTKGTRTASITAAPTGTETQVIIGFESK